MSRCSSVWPSKDSRGSIVRPCRFDALLKRVAIWSREIWDHSETCSCLTKPCIFVSFFFFPRLPEWIFGCVQLWGLFPNGLLALWKPTSGSSVSGEALHSPPETFQYQVDTHCDLHTGNIAHSTTFEHDGTHAHAQTCRFVVFLPFYVVAEKQKKQQLHIVNIGTFFGFCLFRKNRRLFELSSLHRRIQASSASTSAPSCSTFSNVTSLFNRLQQYSYMLQTVYNICRNLVVLLSAAFLDLTRCVFVVSNVFTETTF